MKQEMTESQIYTAIAELERMGEKGELTPSKARHLSELRDDLRQIHRAKWPHAIVT